MAKRIQRRRTGGWRMPEGAVYVGRPSKWGNPYRWSDYPTVASAGWGDDDPQRIPESTRRRHAVTDFRSAVAFGDSPPTGYPTVDDIRRELAGRDLACWCDLDQPCHADVLLELANGGAR